MPQFCCHFFAASKELHVHSKLNRMIAEQELAAFSPFHSLEWKVIISLLKRTINGKELANGNLFKIEIRSDKGL